MGTPHQPGRRGRRSLVVALAAMCLAGGPWPGRPAAATAPPDDVSTTVPDGSTAPLTGSTDPVPSTPPASTDDLSDSTVPASSEPPVGSDAPIGTDGPNDSDLPSSEPVDTESSVPPDTQASDSEPTEDGVPLGPTTLSVAAAPVSCSVMNPVRPGSPFGVRCLETALRSLGYIGFAPDDVLSAATRSALVLFQRDQALAETGIGDPPTLQALGIWSPPPAAICTVSVPVRAGSTLGSLCVEARLRQLGYTGQTPDHVFNATSVIAVRNLQYSYGLAVTGVADRTTLTVMGIWSTPPAPTCSVRFPVRPGSVAGARCVEQRLRELGFTGQAPDDLFNPTSVQALRNLQHTYGLSPSGVADATTATTMGIWSAPPAPTCRLSFTVRAGSVAGSRCVEARLRDLGFTAQQPDDRFNSSSVTALRLAQYAYGLAVDGIAGPNTLGALGLWNAPPAPGCVVSVTVGPGSATGVRCLETRLRQLGLTGQAADDVFTQTTATALGHFQYSVGIPPTGVADKPTLQALGVWRDPPNPYPVPANSGSGRRIVYSRSQQRIWAVNADGTIAKTHRVSGRLREPYAGTYYVYSRSEYTYSASDPSVRWRYMVRFAYGPNGGRIGFHEIPNRNGVPLQSREQLGLPLSAGCVRQSTADARWIWNWAPVGTKVVVL